MYQECGPCVTVIVAVAAFPPPLGHRYRDSIRSLRRVVSTRFLFALRAVLLYKPRRYVRETC